MTPSPAPTPGTAARIAMAIYAVFLLLLLLSPEPVEQVLNLQLGTQHGRAEEISNVLIFIPVGFAAAWWLYSRLGAVAVGVFLSVAVEVAQHLWLPHRDAAWSDIVKNALGTTIGALLHRTPNASAAPQPGHRGPR